MNCRHAVHVVFLQHHDYVSEQPVTIWTEMRDRAHVSIILFAIINAQVLNSCRCITSLNFVLKPLLWLNCVGRIAGQADVRHPVPTQRGLFSSDQRVLGSHSRQAVRSRPRSKHVENLRTVTVLLLWLTE